MKSPAGRLRIRGMTQKQPQIIRLLQRMVGAIDRHRAPKMREGHEGLSRSGVAGKPLRRTYFDNWSRARLSFRTFTRGSPRKPSVRP